jgi:Domain of unknown function (DUF6798)
MVASSHRLRPISLLIKYGLPGFYLILIVLVSYCRYPGASICEEDTQIYLPLLLKAQDASLLKNDLITQHPHTAFTLFDELVLFISRFFRWSLPVSLTALQLASRGLLLSSFFLLFRTLGCGREIALALAGLMMLGGAIPGAQILIVEYEPVPRGLAFSLTLAGLALVVRRRVLEGTLLGCLGFLLHPTTTLPFWIGWLTVLSPDNTEFSPNQRLGAATLPLASTLFLTIIALSSSPGEQSRYFLSFIDKQWEVLLKLRTPYVFVSEWNYCDFYLLFLTGLILWLAWRRCQPVKSRLLRSFVFATVLWGSITIPASWVLLDQFRLAILPQLQPARALIFMVTFTLIFSWAAAWKGLAAEPLKLENHLWLSSSLFLALDRSLLLLLWPVLILEVLRNTALEKDFSRGWRRCIRGSGLLAQLLFVAFIAILRPCSLELFSWVIARNMGFVFLLSLALGITVAKRPASPRLACPSLPILTILLLLALPSIFKEPAAAPDRREILNLASWAKSMTPVDAVFLFSDVGRDKSPGVFRFYANRAVFVDWKAGGQVNFSRSFAIEWGRRWEDTREGVPNLTKAQEFAGKGIDYLVTQKPHSVPNLNPAYETRTFCVYRLH